MTSHIDEIKEELDLLVKLIVETVPTEQIYLFGSYAYGTPHKDSDIDIYVVLKDDCPMRELDAMGEIHGARYGKLLHKPIDILALKRNRFLYRQGGSWTIEHTIFQQGVKLYG